jgi:hypothetical protein
MCYILPHNRKPLVSGKRKNHDRKGALEMRKLWALFLSLVFAASFSLAACAKKEAPPPPPPPAEEAAPADNTSMAPSMPAEAGKAMEAGKEAMDAGQKAMDAGKEAVDAGQKAAEGAK